MIVGISAFLKSVAPHLWGEDIIAYKRTSPSSNIKCLEVLGNMEVYLTLELALIISTWDESATKPIDVLGFYVGWIKSTLVCGAPLSLSYKMPKIWKLFKS